MDVSDPKSVEAGFAAIAGGGRARHRGEQRRDRAGQASIELTEADWRGVMDTNLDGVWRVAQAPAQAMVAAGKGGSIINIASVLGMRVAPTCSPTRPPRRR
jgi:NAD(P)-dependent dehydrogenase (short-subunit alcohol dehydrogenase family)